MQFIDTGFAGLVLWESGDFYRPDNRGSFQELFNQKYLPFEFSTFQVNHSFSVPGVVRGLHYQAGENAQAKIIHVLKGSIFEVVVDLRVKEPTFGKYFAVEITGENRRHLYIPKGFANGLCAGKDGAVTLYQVDKPYDPKQAKTIRWDDGDLNIPWPLSGKKPLLSEADASGISFKEYLKNPSF